MKIVTCGYLLYRGNRELHALCIIGLNCQDKTKTNKISSLRQAANCQKIVSTLDTMWLNNNSKDFDDEQ